MAVRWIHFPEINRAELITETLPDELQAGQVLVRTAYSTISPGTERANLVGHPNVHGQGAPSVKFPRNVGYSSAGVVEKVGEGARRDIARTWEQIIPDVQDEYAEIIEKYNFTHRNH